MRKNIDVAELVKVLQRKQRDRFTGLTISFEDEQTGEVTEYNVRPPQVDAPDPGVIIYLQDGSHAGHVRTGVYNPRLLMEAALHNLDDLDPRLAMEVGKALGLVPNTTGTADNEFLM